MRITAADEPLEFENEQELAENLIGSYGELASDVLGIESVIELALTPDNNNVILLIERLLELNNELIHYVIENYGIIADQLVDTNFSLNNLADFESNPHIIEPLTNLTSYVYLLTHLYNKIGSNASSISDCLISSFDQVDGDTFITDDARSEIVDIGEGFFNTAKNNLVSLIILYDRDINLENIANYVQGRGNNGELDTLLACYKQIDDAQNDFCLKLANSDRQYFEDAKGELAYTTSQRLRQASPGGEQGRW